MDINADSNKRDLSFTSIQEGGIKLKKIHYHKITYEGLPSVGDSILIGIDGLWTITHIDKYGCLWCGSVNTYFKKDTNKKILHPQFITWLNSLYKHLSVGSTVVGKCITTNIVYEGVVKECTPFISRGYLWVTCSDKITRRLNIFSIKVVPY